MSIARDISRQTSIQTTTLTADQTSVTVTGGFNGSNIEVYLNGVRLVQGQDFTLNGTSGIVLTQGAAADDIIEFNIRNTSNSGFSSADTGQIVDGAITSDKLSTSGTESVNVKKRVAFAWIKFNGALAAASMKLDSYNVDTITDNGLGNYDVNFTTAASSADYASVASCNAPVASTQHAIMAVGSTSPVGSKANTTSYCNIRCFNATNSNSSVDCIVYLVVFANDT
jgi:hypothetical protein